jgi:TP901 family phage tail tape measure protein
LQENFARLGFSPAEIEQVTQATLDLAITTGESLPEAAEVAAGTLRGYRLQASETERVTNVMALSFSRSALNLERFRESQKLVSPIAAQLNVDIETVTGALGKLADNQISGSLAGTALRNILAELGNENSKLSQRLGVVVNDSASFQEALQRLKSSSIDTAEAQELVGNRAFGSLLILKENADAVSGLSGELNNASEAYVRLGDGSIVPLTEEIKESGESYEVLSAAQRGATIASDTLNGDIKALGSAVSEAAIQFGEASSGGLRQFIQFLTQSIPFLTEYSSLILKIAAALALYVARQKLANKETIIGQAATRAYTVALQVFSGQLRATTLLTNLFGKATANVSKAIRSNPIGVFITVLAGLAIAFSELFKRNEAFRKSVTEIGRAFDPVIQALGRLASAFQPVFAAFGRLVSGFVGAVETTGLLSASVKVLSFVADALAAVLFGVVSALAAIVETLVALPKFIRENQAAMTALAAAFVAFNAEAIAAAANSLRQAAAQRAAAIATKAQAVAQRVLNAVMKANPIGLVITALTALAGVFAAVYKRSQTLRSGIAGTFSALKQIVGNVVGGLVKQLTGFGNILKGVFTLDLETIKKGAEQYTQGTGDIFLRAGQGAGEAFTDGFREKTLADIGSAVDEAIASGDSQLADKVNESIVTALEKGQITNAQADAFQDKLIKALEPQASPDLSGIGTDSASASGASAAQSYNDAFIDGLGNTDAQNKAAEARAKALENIRKLETSLVSNEFDQQRQTASQGAASDISGLVGDPEQIRRQETLIKSQLALSISEIEKSRIDSFSSQIEKARERAAQDISRLVGSQEEIAQQAQVIRSALRIEIQNITTSRTQSVDSAISELESSRQREIDALVGSEEEIAANTEIINSTYQRAISQLTEARKAATSEQEAEVFRLRQEIIREYGGQLSETLKTTSAEELQAAKQAVEQRLSVLDDELQATRQRIEQRADLERLRLSEELQGGVSASRAQEIANELKAIDDKLKADLLKAEQDSAKKRLSVVSDIVPNSLKFAQELADKEVEINANKNAKILEQEKQRAELEKEIKKSLQDAAFTLAEGFISATVEREKQEAEAESQRERSREETQSQERTRQLEEEYARRIELAQGNTQEQARLESELATKKEQIETETARKLEFIERREAIRKRQIAIKEALINAALSATKTLANLGLPAAIPALIGLAATTAAQIATIRSQQFEEGGPVAEMLKGTTVRLYEAGASLSKSKSEASVIASDITRFASRSAVQNRNSKEVNQIAYKLSEVGSAMADATQGPAKSVLPHRSTPQGLTDISRNANAAIPVEGKIKGPAHSKGGIKASFKGSPIEVEGGEYILRNGQETYIINKKSSQQFRPQLESLKGSPGVFRPEKRAAASSINSFRGYGVKFQTGAALLRNPAAIEPPQGLQNIRQQVTRGELQSSLIGISTGLTDQAKAIEDRTGQIAQSVQQQIAAVNARIDRLVVINDPEEVVRIGGNQIQAQNNAEL